MKGHERTQPEDSHLHALEREASGDTSLLAP